MRVGVFGARADRRGLAVQSTEFCRHMRPERVFGVDMGLELSPYPCSWDDYQADRLTVAERDAVRPETVRPWLEGLDVVVGFETFYFEWFTSLAAERRVATLLAVNPEFVGHVLAPDWAPRPTLLVPPTTWRLDELGAPAQVVPHGVCRHRLPFRQRTAATTFLHVGGHPAIFDRAGTSIVLEALSYVTAECDVLVRSQRPLQLARGYGAPPIPRHVHLRGIDVNLEEYWHVYDVGDVLLTPRRYGGQHLPMMEALSAGMPVLASDCEPQRALLPPEMLVPTFGGRTFYSKVGPLPLADVHPRSLAGRMDQLAAEPALVERLSVEADHIAERHSWPAVAPTWRAAFDQAVRHLGVGTPA